MEKTWGRENLGTDRTFTGFFYVRFGSENGVRPVCPQVPLPHNLIPASIALQAGEYAPKVLFTLLSVAVKSARGRIWLTTLATSMNPAQTLKVETFFDFIKKVAEGSVLVGGFLFLLGWSYLYGYCRGFGLSPTDLDISVDNVLVHSIPVISGTAFWVGTLAVVILASFLSSIGSTRRLLSRATILLPLVLFGAVAVSKYAVGIGRDNAHRDAFVSTSTLPYVSLEGARDTRTAGCSLDESNYRLLLRSGGQVVVVLPIDSDTNIGTANLRVCSFPESRVQAMRIQVGLGGR